MKYFHLMASLSCCLTVSLYLMMYLMFHRTAWLPWMMYCCLKKMLSWKLSYYLLPVLLSQRLPSLLLPLQLFLPPLLQHVSHLLLLYGFQHLSVESVPYIQQPAALHWQSDFHNRMTLLFSVPTEFQYQPVSPDILSALLPDLLFRSPADYLDLSPAVPSL